MEAAEFARRYPVLYHAASAAAWPSLRRHGLLSTQALVDLFGPPEEVRAAILSQRRAAPVTLHREGLEPVTIRDQKPLQHLEKSLHEGVHPQDFLDALNERVFFWVSEQRLERLLKAYPHQDNLVISIDTAALLSAFGDVVELAAYNTGTIRTPPPYTPRRGPDVFVPMARYSFEEWRRQRPGSREPIVEFTVPHGVPNVTRFVRCVELRGRDGIAVPFDLGDAA